jgi:hypothetical protein
LFISYAIEALFDFFILNSSFFANKKTRLPILRVPSKYYVCLCHAEKSAPIFSFTVFAPYPILKSSFFLLYSF